MLSWLVSLWHSLKKCLMQRHLRRSTNYMFPNRTGLQIFTPSSLVSLACSSAARLRFPGDMLASRFDFK
jgi:hypothetical protein